MKIGMRPVAAVIATVLWTGPAVADEPLGPGDLLSLGGAGSVETLSSDELAAARGGQSVSWSSVKQSAAAGQGLEFKENGITVDRNGQISTGGALSLAGNSGGINSMMTNSGNNVSFQNSTVLNVYLGAGSGAGAP